MSPLESAIDVIGTLGAYFVVVLTLALTVEIVLDSLKINPWLNKHVQSHEWLSFLDVRKKRVSPEQLMRDINYWVPNRSQAELQIAALNQFSQGFGVALEEVIEGTEATVAMTNDLISLTGMTQQAAQIQHKIAARMAAVRKLYDAEEGVRISRLRRVSAILGVLIALPMQLNAFAYLSPLLDPTLQEHIDTPYMAVCGALLTGLASSAGSSFWHDVIDRMRAVKDSARALQRVTAKPTLS